MNPSSQSGAPKPLIAPANSPSASKIDAKKSYYEKLAAIRTKRAGEAAHAIVAARPLFDFQFQEFDQGELDLDSDCELAREELGPENHRKKCRVRLEVLSEKKLEQLLRAPGEDEETIATAPIRRATMGRAGIYDHATMLGQNLKIKRQPTKREEKEKAAAEAAAAAAESAPPRPESQTEVDAAAVVETGERPVRSTRGKNKKYDDDAFKEGEFSDKESGSDDDDAPLSREEEFISSHHISHFKNVKRWKFS